MRLECGLRKDSPRAHQLTVVAAVDAVADQRAQFNRDATLEFDGEIGNAAARIQPVRCNDRLGRARIDTAHAGATMILLRTSTGSGRFTYISPRKNHEPCSRESSKV